MVGAALPRPVPKLVVADAIADPDVVIVDFHSHTEHSWDGRRGFTLERSREWHERTGFNVAYVTDHAHVTPVDAAAPAVARSEEAAGTPTAMDARTTRLLPGIELRYKGQHVVLLGAQARDSAAFEGGNLHLPRLTMLEATPGRSADDTPVILLTIPGDPGFARSHPEVLGVESFDATPRALGRSRTAERHLDDLTDSLRIARVASSNNHGWENEAGAWSVMRVPHWRDMDVRQLDLAIRENLRTSRTASVTVIERRRVATGGPVTMMLTGPALVLEMLRTLSWPERAAWLVWTWGMWALLAVGRDRRERRETATWAAVH